MRSARQAVALVRATRPTDPSAGEDVKKYARYGAIDPRHAVPGAGRQGARAVGRAATT